MPSNKIDTIISRSLIYLPIRTFDLSLVVLTHSQYSSTASVAGSTDCKVQLSVVRFPPASAVQLPVLFLVIPLVKHLQTENQESFHVASIISRVDCGRVVSYLDY